MQCTEGTPEHCTVCTSGERKHVPVRVTPRAPLCGRVSVPPRRVRWSSHACSLSPSVRRCSLQSAPLSLKKSSVKEGLVSASELEELCRLLGESLDAEASRRVHNVTCASVHALRTHARALPEPRSLLAPTPRPLAHRLIAVNHVPMLCRTLGRNARAPRRCCAGS